MPLNPDVVRLLKIMESSQIPDIWKIDVNELRAMNEKPVIPKNVERVEDVKDMEFEHHGIHIPVRLYTPVDAGDGIIIYFHGGGYVIGSRNAYDGICRMAANRSKTKVLSVEYRLAPENKFPAALDDAFEAFLWVQKNAEVFGVNPSKIAVAGDSAGGGLSAAVCLKAKDEKKELPVLQILLYPSVGMSLGTRSRVEYSERFYLTDSAILYFNKAYEREPSDELNPYFSMLLHPDLSGLPEAIVITAEYDPLRDSGEAYLAKLEKAGVRATGIRAKGMIHGFASFYFVIPAAEDILTMVWSLVGSKLNGLGLR